MARNLSAAETAERLGISVRTLDRMEVDGRLVRTTSTPGGHRRFDEEQVERVRQGLPAVECVTPLCEVCEAPHPA